jgi:hypothetical protein
MKRFSISLLFVFVTLFVFSSKLDFGPSAAPNSNWPQWRGPDSQGISNEKNLPTEWSETKNVLWKTALPGRGFSQPIIWGRKVFLTTDIEGGPEPTGYKSARKSSNTRTGTARISCTRLKRSAWTVTAERFCGSGPLTKAASTTTATSVAITPLPRLSPTADTSIPTSVRKASIVTTSTAS